MNDGHLAVVPLDRQGGGHRGHAGGRGRGPAGGRRAPCRWPSPAGAKPLNWASVTPDEAARSLNWLSKLDSCGVDVGRGLDRRDLGADLLQVGTVASTASDPSDCSAVSRAWSARLLALELHGLGLEARQLRVLRGDQDDPQDEGDDEGATGDDQWHPVLPDGVHFRLAFLLRLAVGVTEMVKGNEIVESGLTVVAPCSGLAKYCDPDTALIHASEMERLGPGPVHVEVDRPDGRRLGAGGRTRKSPRRPPAAARAGRAS